MNPKVIYRVLTALAARIGFRFLFARLGVDEIINNFWNLVFVDRDT